ncbi:hypothetical protein BH09GEM1_BH09GEM1_29140 [soil metagenome]
MHPLSAVATIATVATFTAAGIVPNHRRSDVTALAPLIGEWQSDTVRGVSARSTCVWTPRHGALLCEQRVEGPLGASTALNLFTADSVVGGFVLYVLSRPGSTVAPLPLGIRGAEWFYGGRSPSNDGRWYRTVNDFSRADSYEWRQETSRDGKQWTAGIHGVSRRVH